MCIRRDAIRAEQKYGDVVELHLFHKLRHPSELREAALAEPDN